MLTNSVLLFFFVFFFLQRDIDRDKYAALEAQSADKDKLITQLQEVNTHVSLIVMSGGGADAGCFSQLV